MRRVCWLTGGFTLWLLIIFLTIPVRGLAQPAIAESVPADARSPILDPFINIWDGDGIANLDPVVAYNNRHDEYLVVWYNYQSSEMWDIYARRVGGDGTLLSWFSVASDAGYHNWQPDVAYSPAQDEYLIVYAHEPVTDDYDIWAKRVSWNGGYWAQFPINTDVDRQWNPAVAYNSQDDEYLVVYENYWAGGLRDIAAQRVRAWDGKLLSWRNIATGAGQERLEPDVAYNEARNEYLIVYTFGGGGDGNIYGKVSSASMGTLNGEIHICDDSYDQQHPSVAAGPDEYLVTWDDGTWLTDDYDIFARRLTGEGVPQGPIGGFPIAMETANFHAESAVAYGSGYGYLVTWQFDEGGLHEEDVYGRYVMPGGDQAAGDAFEIDAGPDAQRSPALACDSAGDCLVVEEDTWPEVLSEIRGRFVRPHHVYLPLVLAEE